jgi:hypothetical protein
MPAAGNLPLDGSRPLQLDLSRIAEEALADRDRSRRYRAPCGSRTLPLAVIPR